MAGPVGGEWISVRMLDSRVEVEVPARTSRSGNGGRGLLRGQSWSRQPLLEFWGKRDDAFCCSSAE